LPTFAKNVRISVELGKFSSIMAGMTGGEQQQGAGSADQQIGDLLGRVFGCSAELADHIRHRGRVRAYPTRVTIVKQGDRISTLYAVIAGRAHALVYSVEGQAVLLHEYRSGDLFGVMTSPYSATHDADVVAVEDVSAFLLDGVVLALLAEQHTCIGMALLKFMVERLQQTSSRMYEHAALSAVGRVYAELLRQAKESPELTIRPTPVVSDLALRVSTTRETASRAVNALERRGIIRRDAEALVVVAPHRLEELIL
jgi:CRP-like cAMP-binding protein